MRITYEAEVISNLRVNKDQIKSCIEWKSGDYRTDNLYIGGQLPLGSKVWVVVTDVDPDSEAVGETTLNDIPDDAPTVL